VIQYFWKTEWYLVFSVMCVRKMCFILCSLKPLESKRVFLWVFLNVIIQVTCLQSKLILYQELFCLVKTNLNICNNPICVLLYLIHQKHSYWPYFQIFGRALITAARQSCALFVMVSQFTALNVALTAWSTTFHLLFTKIL
jgi:hypothetical protein